MRVLRVKGTSMCINGTLKQMRGTHEFDSVTRKKDGSFRPEYCGLPIPDYGTVETVTRFNDATGKEETVYVDFDGEEHLESELELVTGDWIGGEFIVEEESPKA